MMKKIGVLLISVLLFICFLLGGVYVYVKSSIYEEEPTIVEEIKNDSKEEEDEVNYSKVEGITNVLLIGMDKREDESSRSDSIIIATLDSKNSNIKLTSLYRDTLVDIPGYGKDRINAAFQLGGVGLLEETIENTYGLQVNKYITIDFNGFEKIIDEIGGIELDIQENQIEELNKYIGESTGGNDCPITQPGKQLLNGKQALSYSRIRYNVGDDYGRVERQREVLTKIAEKIKETSPVKYLGIMDVILEYIKTNIDPIDALNMAYTIFKFDDLEIKQISIPVLELTKDIEYGSLGSVLITDTEQNGKILNDFIYKNEMPNSDNYNYGEILFLISQYENHRVYDKENSNVKTNKLQNQFYDEFEDYDNEEYYEFD